MKDKIKYIGFGLLATLLMVQTGCAGFDEFKSETLKAPVVLGLTVGTVKDSSIVINAVNPSDGYITLGITTGEVDPIDAEAFFKQNIAGVTFLTKKVLKNQAIAFTFSELVQYANYTIIGVSSNADGVLGEPVTITAKTADTYGPVLVSTSPTFAGDLAPVLTTDGKIVLEFDEPVVYKSNKVVKYDFYNDGNTVEGSDLTIAVSGNKVTLTSKVLARNREIIFISWDEGAFTDLTGNPVAQMESGLDADDNLMGIFMRVKLKLFAPQSFSPSTADTLAAGDFTEIKLVYAEKVGGFHANYMNELVDRMTVTYTDANGDKTIKVVPNENVSWAGTTATIALPKAPEAGQTIDFDMKSYTLKIGLNNPADALTKSWIIK